jgi:hypothetical protein
MSTQTDMIIAASSFNAKDIGYTKSRINKAGGKSVGILNKYTKSGGRQLYLSMPLMLTWGVNKRVDETNGRVSFDMSLQFPKDEYSTDQTRAVQAAFESMEEQIKKDAITNSKDWFNKPKLTDAQVDVLFNPMMYWSKDKETGERRSDSAPTLRVKLDCWDDSFKCEIYDVEHKTLYPNSDSSITPVELITKGCNVATIIKCGGVYFVNGKFGVTWRLHQALVKPKASITGKCFISLTTSEVTQISSQADVESDGEDVEVVESESDNEDIQKPRTVDETVKSESVAAEETDSKTPKKKIIRRKNNTDKD